MSHVSQEELEHLKLKGLSQYKPHQKILFEKGDYLVKVAETQEELIQTFKMRYQVYGRYYKCPPPIPLDIDEYDPKADHIIVINKKLNEFVGTYRVLCSDFTKDFYTAREFQMCPLLKMDSKFVEMGRATVAESRRSGVVIALLWRGLGDYISQIKADYLFGCATLWTQDFKGVVDVWKYFEQNELYFSMDLQPLEGNTIPNWSAVLKEREEDVLDVERLKGVHKSLPPLFKSYIKAGAKFGRTPANDPKLQSVDFFTICKVSELSEKLIKKYL